MIDPVRRPARRFHSRIPHHDDPTDNIYVRAGWNSYAWSYAGTAITAVSFDAASALGQQLWRGSLQTSRDGGQTWLDYTVPLDGQGAWVPATGTLWRFQDRSNDDYTPNRFAMHYRLADGSTTTLDNTVVVDYQPTGVVAHNDLLFTTQRSGALVDTLVAGDSGDPQHGRWVIDAQSQPGLFAIAYDPAADTSARLVLADAGRLPAAGLAASVTVHYYDRYQLDTAGNPIPGQGFARTLSYTVEEGTTHGLAGLGPDLALGAGFADAVSAWGGGADPALARLSTGGFVAVWQGADLAAGGAGAGVWARLVDAAGKPLGAPFALTPDGDARLEGQPAVTALADGRFAVAYQIADGGASRVAYRVVAADGMPGAEHVLATGAMDNAGMPAIATLADGSFAVAWKSGGAVHVQGVAADGTPAGAQQDIAALGSASSPALAPLAALGPRRWVLAWGEMNDGNVHAATSADATPFVVGGDGYAASIATAAPLPHVAALADGGFVVAWDSYVNAPYGFMHNDIFFQRFDGAGNALGAAVQANTDSFGGRYDAAVTALSDGSFLVVWQSGDGDGNGIVGRRFGLDGTALDEREFAVSGQRDGDQSGADVVALPGGGFAAAWTDVAADGSVSVEARVLPGAVSTAAGGTIDLGSLGTIGGAAVDGDAAPSPAPGTLIGSALLVSVTPDQETIAQTVGVRQSAADLLFWA